jgi:hypothetical protein
MPLYPEVVRAPTPFLSIVFIFGLVVESIKELWGASIIFFIFEPLYRAIHPRAIKLDDDMLIQKLGNVICYMVF